MLEKGRGKKKKKKKKKEKTHLLLGSLAPSQLGGVFQGIFERGRFFHRGWHGRFDRSRHSRRLNRCQRIVQLALIVLRKLRTAAGQSRAKKRGGGLGRFIDSYVQTKPNKAKKQKNKIKHQKTDGLIR